MPIDVKDVYDQAFEAQRHASDFRAKIIGGWAASYTAFAALFVWVRANHEKLVWVVAIAAAVMTLMMWFADVRNRPAIHRAKAIGERIESATASGIPEEWRFFATLDKGIPHSSIIDCFGALSLVMLIGAALCL